MALTIFIGGIFGVGKTTLSYNLSALLKIKQRTSVGVITKTLQFINNTDPAIRTLNEIDRENDGFITFSAQANKVCQIVNHITDVSRNDGVDYIIDGVQLIPEYLNMDTNSFYFFISSPNVEELKLRLNLSSTHKDRYKNVTFEQVNNLIMLNNYLTSKVIEGSNIKILDGRLNEEDLVDIASKLILPSIKNSD